MPASAAHRVPAAEGPPAVDVELAAALLNDEPLTQIERHAFGDRWQVEAPADGWVLFDRAWWPSWLVTVDGVEVPVYEALGGQIVQVAAGRHEIVATLTPRELGLGALLGVAALLFAAGWVGWPRWRAASIGRP